MVNARSRVTTVEERPPMLVDATHVRAASARIIAAHRDRSVERVEAVRRATTQLRARVATWETEVRAELAAQVATRDRVGAPPSYVALAGLGHLERPLNRLFGWWARRESGHGLSRAFLRKLALRAGAEALARDLEEEDAEVHSESVVDDSGKMPDLLVRTTHCALLLENKHGAGETGDQYTSYLRLLEGWAGEGRERRAVFCARRDVGKPDGWHAYLLHRDVAGLFRELVQEPGATTWARISALVTAEAFEDCEVGTLLDEARALLGDRRGDLAARIRRMRELTDTLEARPVVLPWRDDEGAG